MNIDILATLENCIVALGGMRLRVDQGTEIDTARGVMNSLYDVHKEIKRQQDEKTANQHPIEEQKQEREGEAQ